MASIQKSISIKNCCIDPNDWTATEYKKDAIKSYDLQKILKDYSNIEGVSITISVSDEASQFESDGGDTQE